MTLMLILVLILVVLIIVDLYRKSLRIKQKDILEGTQQKDGEQLLEQAKSSSTYQYVENVQREYPLLREGFLLLYFEGIGKIEVKDLATFLKYYGVKYTDEKVFQKLNYNDVIFSILPDSEEQIFVDIKQDKVDGIVAVMNYRKLANMEYDIKTCYELMMDILEAMGKSFHGTLMNEHKIRLTNKDKQNYLEAIL
ncbi:cell division protein ZipA C-terminal FtsZ-binding domain-containing protein [Francisella sp. 19X1-34]|uniref:cell division protein ZipA C-terminal FtsZ-binding domain-containing protein n=1 Tax=Francisella sp. 19X1-34 TaxID=3087177 RepID=UPI002E36B7BB|nr:cell division protein ZipA C-terminal FtsZ-binding domain-containing protein [Francisella sp. 19X1-34]MED7787474.1 cell division protein ZipA C-terminal FtsZ-binding domain-containing protein [Francisella sp. 19X1-34]